MITEEKNSRKERDARKEKLKKIWNVDLHEDYEMDWETYPVVIKHKGTWKGYPAANVTLKNDEEDIIRIVFESDCEKDLDILRICLHQTNNKFSVEVDDNGYY